MTLVRKKYWYNQRNEKKLFSRTRGTYYLRTNADEPFGQGESKYVRPKTTMTSTTTTTTEKALVDPMKKWIEQKGGSEVTDVKSNDLVSSESRSGKGGASKTYSTSIVFLICFAINRLLTTWSGSITKIRKCGRSSILKVALCKLVLTFQAKRRKALSPQSLLLLTSQWQKSQPRSKRHQA